MMIILAFEIFWYFSNITCTFVICFTYKIQFLHLTFFNVLEDIYVTSNDVKFLFWNDDLGVIFMKFMTILSKLMLIKNSNESFLFITLLSTLYVCIADMMIKNL